MSDGRDHRIITGLDGPVPIFFWDPVEFVVMFMLIGLGIIAKQPVVGFGGAYGYLKLSRAMKRGKKRGQLAHWMWRYGLEIDPSLLQSGFRPTQTEFAE